MEIKIKQKAGRKPKAEHLKLKTRTISFMESDWDLIEIAAESLMLDWKSFLLYSAHNYLESQLNENQNN